MFLRSTDDESSIIQNGPLQQGLVYLSDKDKINNKLHDNLTLNEGMSNNEKTTFLNLYKTWSDNVNKNKDDVNDSSFNKNVGKSATNIGSDMIYSYKKINKATKSLQENETHISYNINKYTPEYEKYNTHKVEKNRMVGMLEDVVLKNKSTNIGYYLWFILAMSGIFIVINELRKRS